MSEVKAARDLVEGDYVIVAKPKFRLPFQRQEYVVQTWQFHQQHPKQQKAGLIDRFYYEEYADACRIPWTIRGLDGTRIDNMVQAFKTEEEVVAAAREFAAIVNDL